MVALFVSNKQRKITWKSDGWFSEASLLESVENDFYIVQQKRFYFPIQKKLEFITPFFSPGNLRKYHKYVMF